METMHFTKANFEKEVLESKEPVIIDFWAPWCGPCRMMGPVIDELAANAEGYKVGKINVDEEPELAIQYGVASIPTLLGIKDGQVIGKQIGATTKERVLALIDQ